MIPFNKVYITGNEKLYIEKAIASGKISGNGSYTKKCEQLLKEKYGLKKVLLASSCTDALEMAALLLNIQPRDEVIVPSFTFVSTANAFALRGANIIFADSTSVNPNISAETISPLITKKTKAILPVHYAGIACEMDELLSVGKTNSIAIIEDAAHAINAKYKNKSLGSFGDLGAYSFHDTKNIVCGEGGALMINNEKFCERAEIIREKGTNRTQFLNGKTDKYDWVDLGSSFLPSELTAAFLLAQLEKTEEIQSKRIQNWNRYFSNLEPLKEKNVQLPFVPKHSEHNAHIFYLVCRGGEERNLLINHLSNKNIQAYFHYQALHKSPFGRDFSGSQPLLSNAEKYTDCLLRLPMYYDLTHEEIDYVSEEILKFYKTI